MTRVATFGEIMLRLMPPGHDVLLQTPRFEATFGGGEANVAVALSNLGVQSAFVSVFPDNSLGDACIRDLRSHGVNTSHIVRGGRRLGVYFVEKGANQRSSKVLYDRDFSSMAEIDRDAIDWKNLFKNFSWFHTTGITPAISKAAADASVDAVRAAKEAGLTVSLDLNYRKKLWKYGVAPVEVIGEMVQYADVVIGNEEDYQECLGFTVDADVESGKLAAEAYGRLIDEVRRKYGHLRHLAVTMRESRTADHNGWSALLHDGETLYQSTKYEIADIVDRLGGGDSFSAGLIYGLTQLDSSKGALEFATAASCLKHSLRGDFFRLSVSDVNALMGGSGSGRVQR